MTDDLADVRDETLEDVAFELEQKGSYYGYVSAKPSRPSPRVIPRRRWVDGELEDEYRTVADYLRHGYAMPRVALASPRRTIRQHVNDHE